MLFFVLPALIFFLLIVAAVVGLRYGFIASLVVFGAGLGLLALLKRWLTGRRRRQFEQLAERLGLSYRPLDASITRDYGFLDVLGKGTNQHAYNVLEGTHEGRRVRVFDYHPTGEGSFDTSIGEGGYDFTVLLLELEAEFPELRILPRNAMTILTGKLGLDEIELESVEFNDVFCVRAADRKLAYDVCHPRMMDCLLECGELAVELERGCLATWSPGLLEVAEIPGRLMQLLEIRELLPEYLFRD